MPQQQRRGLEHLGAVPAAPTQQPPEQTTQTTSTRGLEHLGAVSAGPAAATPARTATGPSYGASGGWNAPPSLGGFTGNLARSTGNLFGNIAEMFLSPVKTMEGMGTLGWGAAEKAVPGVSGGMFEPGGAYEGPNPIDLVFKQLIDRYGSWENVQRTAYEDPAGMAADVSSIMSLGGGGMRVAGRVGSMPRVARTGEALSKASRWVDPLNLAIKGGGAVARSGPVRKAGQAIARGPTSLLAFTTGTPNEYVRRSVHPTPTFEAALRGEITVDDIAHNVRQAVKEVRDQRGAEYRQALGQLPEVELDMTPVLAKVQAELHNFDISLQPRRSASGQMILEPDFSTSKIADPGAQQEIRRVLEDVLHWPNRVSYPVNHMPSPLMDTLKQRLDSYYSQTSDARKFVATVRKSVRDTLSNVPGYDDLTKNYEETSRFLDELQPELSTGPKAAMGTTARKMVGALSRNQDYRRFLIEALDSRLGGTLQDQLAGYAMSRWWPRGLVATGSAMGVLYSMGLNLDPTRVALLALTSPRAVAAGLGAVGHVLPQGTGRSGQFIGAAQRNPAVRTAARAVTAPALTRPLTGAQPGGFLPVTPPPPAAPPEERRR